MDMILGVIQGYEGKTNTTMELMLDMQKSFEEKLEALRHENGAIKTQLDGQKNDSEREKSLGKSREEEKSLQKSLKNKDQSSRGPFQRTKEPTRNKDNEVSDTASSCTITKKIKLVREKKSMRYESEKPQT